MSTSFSFDNYFGASHSRVEAMLQDTGFRDSVLESLGVKSHQAVVTRDGGDTIIRLEVSDSTGVAGTMLGVKEVTVVLEERWSVGEVASLRARAGSLPLRVSGTTTIAEDGPRTHLRVQGDIAFRKFGVGTIAERFIKDSILREIYTKQQELGDSWLTDH